MLSNEEPRDRVLESNKVQPSAYMHARTCVWVSVNRSIGLSVCLSLCVSICLTVSRCVSVQSSLMEVNFVKYKTMQMTIMIMKSFPVGFYVMAHCVNVVFNEYYI